MIWLWMRVKAVQLQQLKRGCHRSHLVMAHFVAETGGCCLLLTKLTAKLAAPRKCNTVVKLHPSSGFMIPPRLSRVHLASLTFCACQIATNEQEMLLQQQQLQQQQLQQTQRAAKAMLNLAHRFITKISPRCRHAASALPPRNLRLPPSYLSIPLAHPLCHPVSL